MKCKKLGTIQFLTNPYYYVLPYLMITELRHMYYVHLCTYVRTYLAIQLNSLQLVMTKKHMYRLHNKCIIYVRALQKNSKVLLDLVNNALLLIYAYVQVYVFKNNSFINPRRLPLLCEISGAVHLRSASGSYSRLTGRLADKIQLKY